MKSQKLYRAIASAVAALGLSSFASAQSSPYRVVYDLRVHGTGAKEALVSNPGDTVTLDLFISVFGTNSTSADDGVTALNGGFRSSTGGLLGDLVGLPTNVFSLGSSGVGSTQDIDGDGDLDNGLINLNGPSTTANGHAYYGVSGGHPIMDPPPQGIFVGQARFSATSLSGTPTTINFYPSEYVTGFSTNKQYYGAAAYVDSVYKSYSGADPLLHINPGVVIRAGQVIDPGPVQYLSGTINTHLTVSGNVEPAPGSSLILADGLDVTSTGTFNALGAGNSVTIKDDLSGNNGGTLAANSVLVGTSATGWFNQSGGFSNLIHLKLGAAAGSSGNLNISGGTVNAQNLTVGGGGNGLVTHSNGNANINALIMGDGAGSSQYHLSGGALVVSGDATIGKSAEAMLRLTGGQANFIGTTNLGSASGGRGFLQVDGGTFTPEWLNVGGAGYGQVDQTAGIVNANRLEVGKSSSASASRLGQYNLAGGKLNATVVFVGDSGNGMINQTGGQASISRLNLKGTGTSTYQLDGGSLNTGNTWIGWKNGPVDSDKPGLFQQNGGVHTVGDLAIGKLGVYQLNGGKLRITKSLRQLGTLDFNNSNAELAAASGSFVDLTGASLTNLTNGLVSGEANSLMSFSSQAALDAIPNFSSLGLVHIAGQPLTIAATQSVGGSGTLQGNLTNNGTLAPGNSPGTIAVTGNYTQDAAAQMLMELAGTASEEFDLLSVSGSAVLDGTLNIALLDDFLPAPTDQFQIITASNLTGAFDTVNVAGGTFDVIYSPTGLTLSNFAAAIPEPTSLLAATVLPLLMRRRRPLM